MKPTHYKLAFVGIFITVLFSLFSCEEDVDSPTNIPETTNTEKEDVDNDVVTDDEIVTETPPDTTTEPETPPISEETLTEAQKILELVNNERSKRGLNKIKLNTELNNAAFNHSKDMNDNNYFDHEGLNGSNFSERSIKENYTGFPRSENIAKGYQNANDVHLGWMKSEGHKKNILLADITEMGLGKSGTLWTQIFGVSRK